jgi:hypothetical protein
MRRVSCAGWLFFFTSSLSHWLTRFTGRPRLKSTPTRSPVWLWSVMWLQLQQDMTIREFWNCVAKFTKRTWSPKGIFFSFFRTTLSLSRCDTAISPIDNATSAKCGGGGSTNSTVPVLETDRVWLDVRHREFIYERDVDGQFSLLL